MIAHETQATSSSSTLKGSRQSRWRASPFRSACRKDSTATGYLTPDRRRASEAMRSVKSVGSTESGHNVLRVPAVWSDDRMCALQAIGLQLEKAGSIAL